MRYLDKLLGEANKFKKLAKTVDRRVAGDLAADKLRDQYMEKHSRTGRGANNDRKQKKRLGRMRAAEREVSKASDKAVELASQVTSKVVVRETASLKASFDWFSTRRTCNLDS